MAAKKKSSSTAQTAQQTRPTEMSKAPASKTRGVRSAAVCDDSCALSAHQTWKSATMTPSFNYLISLTIPAGKRFVIELVTASISVPAGETVRLRMYTAFGSSVSNLDLVVTPQGVVGGKVTFVATHSLRAYADNLLQFNVHRDNATTSGYFLVCVSGYLV